MNFNGKLVLEDGTEFLGVLHQHDDKFSGAEVVFNTSMTGYQEILTDPSYANQIICLTQPMIGNYGISEKFNESKLPLSKGLIVRELARSSKHVAQDQDLLSFLKSHKLNVLSEVDTRALTKHLRSGGVCMGVIAPREMSALECLERIENIKAAHPVEVASAKEKRILKAQGHHVGLLDFGVKENIVRSLHDLGCQVTVLPFNTQINELRELALDGVCLSNGPGDPRELLDSVELVKEIQKEFPVFGICLGHQLLSLANGAKIEKMLYGHRGANQPVQEVDSKLIYSSSQNHGYQVVADSLVSSDLKVKFINLNDMSIEGVSHKSYPAFSVQFHPEYKPGPQDTSYLFQEFLNLMERYAR